MASSDCGEFRLDLSAEFGTCVCGKKKAQHSDLALSKQVSGRIQVSAGKHKYDKDTNLPTFALPKTTKKTSFKRDTNSHGYVPPRPKKVVREHSAREKILREGGSSSSEPSFWTSGSSGAIALQRKAEAKARASLHLHKSAETDPQPVDLRYFQFLDGKVEGADTKVPEHNFNRGAQNPMLMSELNKKLGIASIETPPIQQEAKLLVTEVKEETAPTADSVKVEEPPLDPSQSDSEPDQEETISAVDNPIEQERKGAPSIALAVSAEAIKSKEEEVESNEETAAVEQLSKDESAPRHDTLDNTMENQQSEEIVAVSASPVEAKEEEASSDSELEVMPSSPVKAPTNTDHESSPSEDPQIEKPEIQPPMMETTTTALKGVSSQVEKGPMNAFAPSDEPERIRQEYEKAKKKKGCCVVM